MNPLEILESQSREIMRVKNMLAADSAEKDERIDELTELVHDQAEEIEALQGQLLAMGVHPSNPTRENEVNGPDTGDT